MPLLLVCIEITFALDHAECGFVITPPLQRLGAVELVEVVVALEQTLHIRGIYIAYRTDEIVLIGLLVVAVAKEVLLECHRYSFFRRMFELAAIIDDNGASLFDGHCFGLGQETYGNRCYRSDDHILCACRYAEGEPIVILIPETITYKNLGALVKRGEGVDGRQSARRAIANALYLIFIVGTNLQTCDFHARRRGA